MHRQGGLESRTALLDLLDLDLAREQAGVGRIGA